MEQLEVFDPEKTSFEDWLGRLENRLELLDIKEEKHKGWLRDRGGPAVAARLEGLAAGATFAQMKEHLHKAFTTGKEQVQAKIKWDHLRADGRSFQEVELEARTLARKAGFPLASREVMVLSLLTRLVRQANPYVASLLDDKDIQHPGEYAREADHRMEMFRQMTATHTVAVRRMAEEEEPTEEPAVAWAQRPHNPGPRAPTDPKPTSRYPPYEGPSRPAPPPHRYSDREYRCYACDEVGHFVRECPYLTTLRDEARKRRGQQRGKAEDEQRPLNN